MLKTVKSKNITQTLKRTTKDRLMLYGAGGQTFDKILTEILDKYDKIKKK